MKKNVFWPVLGPFLAQIFEINFIFLNETKWTQNVKNVFLAHFWAILAKFFKFSNYVFSNLYLIYLR